MSSSINGTTIILTRGDSFSAQVTIYDSEGNLYSPTNDDEVRFKVVKSYPARHGSANALIEKVLDNNTLMLELDPADTEDLKFGDYKYDIQITFGNGDVDTFISKATLRITEEVD